MGKLCGPLYWAGCQADVLWQLLQLCPANMPAWKAGSSWQEAHVVGSALIVLPWHAEHARLVCAPVRGKLLWLWSKVAGFHADVLWHAAQLLPNAPLCGSSCPWQLLQVV